jgi:tetratricopeptide (TPR) repeat protein
LWRAPVSVGSVICYLQQLVRLVHSKFIWDKTLMALDPYSSCPCGSGKKFKWCCQPIHQAIDQAFAQDAQGQHETAQKMMDDVVAQHPGNPEAWGRKAQLLYQNGKMEEAEAALQKAYEINPKYPAGHFLQGMFRYNEGEHTGALLLFRKAAEYFDPEARDYLAEVHSLIANCELRMNRPIAARFALDRAIHDDPASTNLRDGLEQIFGANSRLPEAARREYRFQSPAPTITGERRAAWDRTLSSASTGKLNEAVKAFEKLTQEDENDAAAWYNLALARAWLGNNAEALPALDRYVALESDEEKAAAAWTLGEVLRYGQGMDQQADQLDYSYSYQIRDPRPLGGFLQELETARRLIVVPTPEEQGILNAMVLDTPTALITAAPSTQPAPLAANMLVVRNVLRIWNTNKEALNRFRLDLQSKLGQALSEAREQTAIPAFHDIVLQAVAFPIGVTDKAEAEKLVREHAQKYFEEAWIHKPLKALSGVPPIDAAGHGVLRKELRGVITFLEQCSANGILANYDFDGLRRKLGLLGDAAPVGKSAEGAQPNFSAMSVAELADVPEESLSPDQLEMAYQAAQKLDAHELAGRFARTLISLPPEQGKTDRYPIYSYLVQRAIQEGRLDEALDFVNEGEKADCEQNEGGRRNDYELRRGQVLTKRREADQAADVFQRLIERVPTNTKYRGAAAEAMLALKQPTKALRFAEEGLVEARKQNDRDSEGYLMELVGAAKKQGGL